MMLFHLATYCFLDRSNEFSHSCESQDYTALASFKHIMLFHLQMIRIIWEQFSVFIYLVFFLRQDLTVLAYPNLVPTRQSKLAYNVTASACQGLGVQLQHTIPDSAICLKLRRFNDGLRKYLRMRRNYNKAETRERKITVTQNYSFQASTMPIVYTRMWNSHMQGLCV